MRRALWLLPLVVFSACQEVSPSGSPKWIRTDLYLGLTRRDSSLISDAEFQRFVDGRVTPLFPEGFTVTPAAGQYLDEAWVHEGPL